MDTITQTFCCNVSHLSNKKMCVRRKMGIPQKMGAPEIWRKNRHLSVWTCVKRIQKSLDWCTQSAYSLQGSVWLYPCDGALFLLSVVTSEQILVSLKWLVSGKFTTPIDRSTCDVWHRGNVCSELHSRSPEALRWLHGCYVHLYLQFIRDKHRCEGRKTEKDTDRKTLTKLNAFPLATLVCWCWQTLLFFFWCQLPSKLTHGMTGGSSQKEKELSLDSHWVCHHTSVHVVIDAQLLCFLLLCSSDMFQDRMELLL